MKDPERTPLAALVDQEQRAVAPPPGAEERTWQAIVHRLSHGPPPPPLDPGPAGSDPAAAPPPPATDPGVAAGSAGAASTAAGGAGAGAKVLATIVLVGATAGAWALRSGATAPATDPFPVAAVVDAPASGASAPMPTAPEVAPAYEPSAPPAPTRGDLGVRSPSSSRRVRRAPAARRSSAPPSSEATLAEELALVRRISVALRDGRADEALRLAEAHGRRFPQGHFVEERTALHARALCRLGRTAQGRRLARRFLRSHPNSIHQPAVRADCRVGAEKDPSPATETDRSGHARNEAAAESP